MTSSNGNIFRVTGHLCGEFTGPGEFPTQRPVTRSFDVYFDLCSNKRWVNSREAGDFRCHRAHYDVIVMNVCTYRLSHISQIKLQWRHNEHGWVSNHRRIDYLLKRWFRQRSKKTSKLRVTGLCEGNSPVTDEFPTQGASNAENVSIWWRHHWKTVSYPIHLTRVVELTDPWDMRL